MRYRLSSGVPVTYVPAVTCSTKTLSAAAKRNKSGAQRPPEPSGAPASDGKDRNDHGHEDHVADRIRDVRGDACATDPGARLDDRSDHQDGLERGHPQSGDQTIDPDGLRRSAGRSRAPGGRCRGTRMTKNVRKAGVGISRDTGTGLKYCTQAVHRTDPAVKNAEADCQSSPAPAPAASRDCAPGAQRRAAQAYPSIGDPDIKEVVGRARVCEELSTRGTARVRAPVTSREPSHPGASGVHWPRSARRSRRKAEPCRHHKPSL